MQAKRIISRSMRFATLSTSYHPALVGADCIREKAWHHIRGCNPLLQLRLQFAGQRKTSQKKAAMKAAFSNNNTTPYLKV
jgi:hypothetical protein